MNRLSHDQIAVLVVKAQQGDQEAFSMLYAATVERQLAFATAFLKDASLAEDAVQEVYLSMYKALPKLQNPKLFVAYLNRICYNTCVDYKKKYFKQKFELEEDEDLTRISDDSPHNTPHERYEILENQNELYQAVATLPDQQQAAFLMRYYQDMKIRDISQAMDISESTVKRYIRAASTQLKGMLSTIHRERG
ncbi:MAG: RNA polymerase sigma factor [Oscillospiraceae bacterium]